MQDTIATLYRMRQGPHESNEHYMDCFKSNITPIELTKGDHVFFSPGLTGNERATATTDSKHIEEESNKALLLLQRRSGFSSLIYGSILTQDRITHTTIPHDWVLLDSCSTNCVFKNSSLVSSITKCTPHEELEMHTNGGSLIYRHMGQFNFLPLNVYFNNQSIANILSLKCVMDLPGVSITMENGHNPAIVLQ